MWNDRKRVKYNESSLKIVSHFLAMDGIMWVRLLTVTFWWSFVCITYLPIFSAQIDGKWANALECVAGVSNEYTQNGNFLYSPEIFEKVIRFGVSKIVTKHLSKILLKLLLLLHSDLVVCVLFTFSIMQSCWTIPCSLITLESFKFH